MPLLRRSAPSAAGAGPPPVGRRTPNEPCRNCGDPTVGRFCPSCGQRKVEVRVSLRRMAMEVLDDQLSLNSALPRTLGSLFFRPGHLTREYVSGRIVRYIPPFRLYLVSSVLFFLVLSLNLQIGGSAPSVVFQPPAAPSDSAVASAPDGVTFTGRANTGIAPLDSVLNARFDEMRREGGNAAARRLVRGVLEHVPQAMFLLLPLYAGILGLLYVRRGHFYVEHFVFALHVHAFAFLAFTAMTLVSLPLVSGLLQAWIFVYTLLAMRYVYRQGWLVTGGKFLALGAIYSVLLGITLAATFVLTLLVG